MPDQNRELMQFDEHPARPQAESDLELENKTKTNHIGRDVEALHFIESQQRAVMQLCKDMDALTEFTARAAFNEQDTEDQLYEEFKYPSINDSLAQVASSTEKIMDKAKKHISLAKSQEQEFASIRAQIEELDITEKNWSNLLSKLFVSAKQLAADVQINRNRAESLAKYAEQYQQYYKSAHLKRAGYISYEAVEDALVALRQRKYRLFQESKKVKNRFKKLVGASAIPNQISQLSLEEERLMQLDKIGYTSADTFLERQVNEEEFKPRAELEHLIEAVTAKICKSYNEALARLENSIDTAAELPAVLLDSLNEQLIQETLLKRLEEWKVRYGKFPENNEKLHKILEILDNPNYKQQAVEILKKSFFAQTNGQKDSHPNQYKTSADLEAEITAMPEEWQSKIRECLYVGERSSNEAFQDLYHALVAAQHVNNLKVLNESYCEVLTELSSVYEKNNIQFLPETIYNARPQTRKFGSRVSQFNDDLLKLGRDWERLSILTRNLDIRDHLGRENFDMATHGLSGYVADQIVTYGASNSRIQNYEKILFALRRPEEMPVVIGQALYQQSNGFYYREFNTFIKSLTNEDLDKCSKMGVPGLRQALELLRQNPDSYPTVTIQNPSLSSFVEQIAQDPEFLNNFCEDYYTTGLGWQIDRFRVKDLSMTLDGYDHEHKTYTLNKEWIRHLLPDFPEDHEGIIGPNSPWFTKIKCAIGANRFEQFLHDGSVRQGENITGFRGKINYKNSDQRYEMSPEMVDYFLHKHGYTENPLIKRIIDNPFRQQVQEQVIKMVLYFLNHGDKKIRDYMLNAIVGYKADFSEINQWQLKQLLDLKDVESANKIISFHIQRAPWNMQSTEFLITHYDLLPKGMQEKVVRYGYLFAECMIREGKVSEEVKLGVCKITGITIQELDNTLKFLEELKQSGYTETLSNGSDPNADFKMFIRLGNDPLVGPFIKEINKHGYRFDRSHGPMLPLLAKQGKDALNLFSKYTQDNKDFLPMDLYFKPNAIKMVLENPAKLKLLHKAYELMPHIMRQENKNLIEFILQNDKLLLNDENDMVFLNTLTGKYGKGAKSLIEDYASCLLEKVITTQNKKDLLNFLEHFRILSPSIIKAYLEAKNAGAVDIFFTGLKAIAEKMTSGETIAEQEKKLPYYDALLKAVYPNNSGTYTTYENNATCKDRSSDLKDFVVRKRYEIDLLEAGEVKLKEGQALDQMVIEKLKGNILSIAQSLELLGNDTEKLKKEVTKQIDGKFEEVSKAGNFANINASEVRTPEEKLFLLMTDFIYGSKSVNEDELKRLVICYQFAFLENVMDYIQGTTDRVSAANNPNYALLCELNNFYADRIKEVHRALVRTGWSNSSVAQVMPAYFRELTKKAAASEKAQAVAKLQPEKLGLSESFLKQLSRTLVNRTGKTYSPERLKRLIKLYENLTQNTDVKTFASAKTRTKAFSGQLKAQREKTLQAVRIVTGKDVQASDIHLGEINLDEMLAAERNILEGKYDEEQFASYTVQQFINMFGREKEDIDNELAKFTSSSGADRKILYGYITKTEESANARMVGGVCVCGDNPGKAMGKENLWETPNFMQLVLQDPESLRCQGINLMHHFTDENGKKILSVSFNPSSTYVLSSDEKALFRGLLKTTILFAEDNNIDYIMISKNKSIRTNRTGGLFEQEMNKTVTEVNQSYKFKEQQRFSYHPSYHLTDMDIIWQRDNNNG